jgi:hypothetical protein
MKRVDAPEGARALDDRHRQEHERAAQAVRDNFIFDKEATVWSGSSRELAARADLVQQYVGV